EAAAAELTGPVRALHGTPTRTAKSLPNLPSATGNPAGATVEEPAGPVFAGSLNTSSFIVLGEGLAAGMDFALSSDLQSFSFPALMARQMGVSFRQRLIEPPGMGTAPGFEQLPVIVPSPLQTTVIDHIPPETPSNLSVPGYTVADAVRRRVSQPLVDKADSKQTLANFILGLLDI